MASNGLGVNIDHKVEVKENLDALKKCEQAFKQIKKLDVLVGIPQESNAEHAGGVTNAELLYIHTFGSPARNIPARPVMDIAIRDAQFRSRVQLMFKQAFTMSMLGDSNGARRVYEQIGMLGANTVKAKFGTVPPPNAPSTVAAKGSSATLIDTGSLRNAITYVVRDKKK